MTLFLDRDGVLNKRIVSDYVRTWEQFKLLEGVLEALILLKNKFETIVIVTNQQGIGKGLMTSEDLENIHQQFLMEVKAVGGHIDKCYFAPNLKSENSPNRKPAIGMALQAQKDFPNIDFKQSIMVGDSISDMEFGRNAGMTNVFITTKAEDQHINDDLWDYKYDSLLDFAKSIK